MATYRLSLTGVLAGVFVAGVVLTPRLSADPRPRTGDVLQGRRSDPPGEMPGVPSAELDRADVAHHVPGRAPVGARRSRSAWPTRQMPPWHIDQSVGVQQVQERHVADRRADRHDRPLGRRRRAAGRPEGPAAAQAARHRQRVAGRARTASVRRISSIRSSEYTMPAKHQDVWYRPMTDIPLTEPRWAKMVEIRPTNLKGRSILHHSIAYLVLNNDPEAVNTGTANGRRPRLRRRPRQSPAAADGVGDRQGLRPVPRGHGQAAPARREDLVGPAPARGRAKRSRPAPRSASGSTRKARSRRSAAT